MDKTVSYTLLEPGLPSTFGLSNFGFKSDQVTTLFTSTSLLFSLLITIAVMSTVFAWGMGAFYRMEASETGINKSKEWWTRGTKGFLWAMGLFIFLYSFNSDLLIGDISSNNLKTKNTVNSNITSGEGAAGGGGASRSYSDGAEILKILNSAAYNIKINHDNVLCIPSQLALKTPPPPPCTDLSGLPQATITMLYQLRQTCPNAAITITGGTEGGHSSHGQGLTPVDISMNDANLNKCISGFRKGPDLKNWCNVTYSNFGYTFCDEKSSDSHWHVFK
jgi:hypothetical protein